MIELLLTKMEKLNVPLSQNVYDILVRGNAATGNLQGKSPSAVSKSRWKGRKRSIDDAHQSLKSLSLLGMPFNLTAL